MTSPILIVKSADEVTPAPLVLATLIPRPLLLPPIPTAVISIENLSDTSMDDLADPEDLQGLQNWELMTSSATRASTENGFCLTREFTHLH